MAGSPRDAATVIVARPIGEGGFEVLLTRRPETMRFMGGMYVFPGGALDEGDGAPALASLSQLSPQEAVRRLGEEDTAPDVALGLFVCGLRELFEEVGLLIARDIAGRDVDPAVVTEQWAPRQEELAHDPDAFAAFLQGAGLTLATDRLVPHGRLVTPEMSPIRFDARFFVAPFPEGQQLHLDPEEVPEAIWMEPSQAMEAAADERLAIAIPTMAILQGLAEVASYESLLAGEVVAKQILTSKVSPNVVHVLAPNPGLATGPGTNTYVVGEGETIIIDPAVEDGRYIEVVTREAGNRGRPVLILLTHSHPDHVGGAAHLAAQLGCEVAAWEGMEHPAVTRRLRDEEVIRVGGVALRALHTPGHASDHLCFLLEDEGAVFAGDVVAGIGTVVVAPPDGDMAAYMMTLERLRSLPIRRIYPGHGPIVEDGPAKLSEYLAHRRDRERQVLEALAAGDAEIGDMVARIYTDVPEKLHGMAQRSVLAHLEMLETSGRVTRTGDRWSLA